MLDSVFLQSCFKTKEFKIRLRILEKVDSTNEVARQSITEGNNDGLLIVAEQQSGGRGRYDRQWNSRRGGLYFSLVLRPPTDLTNAPLIGLLVSCAVASGLASVGVENISVKWPNDILLGFDKVAGILCELVTVSEDDHLIIVGVGINQNSTSSDFPLDYEYSFITVRDYVGRITSREELLCAIINKIDEFLVVVKTEKSYESIMTEWRRWSSTLGNKVRVTDGSEVYIGVAEDILEDGSLSVLTDDGRRIVRIGDITHLRND